MSWVSGVTLQVDLGEDTDIVEAVIVPWLKSEGHGTLEHVEDHYGGRKHPQVTVFGGGFNYLDDDALAELVMKQRWNNPGNVVLLINPEEGETIVVRP